MRRIMCPSAPPVGRADLAATGIAALLVASPSRRLFRECGQASVEEKQGNRLRERLRPVLPDFVIGGRSTDRAAVTSSWTETIAPALGLRAGDDAPLVPQTDYPKEDQIMRFLT